MSNPVLELLVDTVGRDHYRETWRRMSPMKKLWYTLRGWQPGGRKGAPSLD